MMENTTREDLTSPDQNQPLTDDEQHLAGLYQAVGMARRIEPQQAMVRVRRRIGRRLKVRRLIQVLSVAAALLLLFGIRHWLGMPDAADHPKHEQPVSQNAPERSEKAILVLSDGSTVNLDTLNQVSLTDAGIAISSQQGSLLAYKPLNADLSDAPKTNKIIVPPGGRFQLMLSDGSKVWLNAATSLEYPVAFGKVERIVRLSGEAFFEVEADKSRPFIIETDNGRIQVLGTSFNVSAYQDDEFMETTLVSGSLQVSPASGPSSRLSPGQQHKLNQHTFEQTVKEVDTKFYTSWRDGVIYFNRVSLRELAVKLERWYDVKISFENEKSAGLIFSGAVENSRRLDFLLTLIAEASGIEFKINGKQVVIK